MTRRSFCLILFLVSVLWLHGLSRAHAELRSLDPNEILTKLDLSTPELKAVQAKQATDRAAALGELLAYYRKKYAVDEPAPSQTQAKHLTADGIVNHVFQWGPYEPADYGRDMDWQSDPRGDIEWVAAVYRFYWARDLANTYQATGDEKYARAFVELASDWIAKHPLEDRDIRHPVYTHWRGFPWLDIQTGIRADVICSVFPIMVHADSFTPEFLGVLLASLYDHQVKTEADPMGVVHNKAIFEQRGFVAVASTFPEFRDSHRWMELAMKRTRDNFLAQVTPDGVQREWSFGYNRAVLNDAIAMLRRMDAMGISVPDDYRERIHRMHDYIFAIATPELAGPMFGDASRSPARSGSRSAWPLYATLIEASDLWDNPKYAARAKLNRDKLPGQTSYAFRDAGTYVFRDDWGPEQIYFALHCPPKGISGHDQPDNGTFELCAFGRWLMPDSGFYTYGHDAKGRAWHRQTSVHQTLTLNGATAKIAGRQLLWHTSPEVEAVTVENASYENLVHRRTVWFVDKTFFVLLDEAIGTAEGTLDLHFQLAPGAMNLDAAHHTATTSFDDANVLISTVADGPLVTEEEEGWHAWKYGHRTPRPAFRHRHGRSSPAAFLTVVYPYREIHRPEISVSPPEAFDVGADRVEVRVEANGKTWRLGRDLQAQKAWCGAVD